MKSQVAAIKSNPQIAPNQMLYCLTFYVHQVQAATQGLGLEQSAEFYEPDWFQLRLE